MHFLMIGGSGRTGKLIINEALSKGHHVTAVVRSTSSLTAGDNLTVVEGSPLKESDIDSAFRATPGSIPSAVVVALNARRSSDSPFAAPSSDTPPRMMADSVANAIKAMKKHGVRKIVIMSSMGTGDSFAHANYLMRLMFTHSNMSLQMVDHNAVDTETKAAGVDYTLVRPVMLADGNVAEVKVYPDNGKGSGFIPKVSRASVAAFMVRALETDEFVRRTPVITN
ncbi:NAD-dependent epimerase/dehydratase-like protein [Xylariales sp. AK1849]|nr:NAD-dependent epimerase/dehydratase-like protein [Xylariales sp. AK1849]